MTFETPEPSVPPGHDAYLDALHAHVTAWFQAKLGRPFACPMCNEKRWSISDPGDIPGRGPWMVDKGYPTLLFICQNCAYSMLFNAAIMQAPDPRAWLNEHEPVEPDEQPPRLGPAEDS